MPPVIAGAAFAALILLWAARLLNQAWSRSQRIEAEQRDEQDLEALVRVPELAVGPEHRDALAQAVDGGAQAQVPNGSRRSSAT
jgi:hypothetical protein